MNFKSKDKSNMVLHHQVLVSHSYEDRQMVRVSKIDEGIINFIISTEEFSGQFANFMKNALVFEQEVNYQDCVGDPASVVCLCRSFKGFSGTIPNCEVQLRKLLLGLEG